MNKRLFFAIVMLFAFTAPATAYDFSAVSPSGHMLYYNFVNGSARVINVSGNENSYRSGGYLSGDLIIPDTVYYSGYPIAVGSIGAYAFTACNITSVTIPKTVTLVRQFVFYQCNSLKTVNYTGTLSQWCSITFEHDQSNPLAHAKKLYINGEHVVDVNITAGISEIKPFVFYCSDIHSVSIPNTVTTIGENAFADCLKLQPVTIPSSVNNIGYRAFGNVPMVFYYGTMSGAPWGARFLNGYVEDSLYFSSSAKNTIVGCIPDKKNVVIPNTVTTIYNMAFYCYDEIKSVTIPSSVTTIQSMAFYNCESLIPVTIPSSVNSIGSNAFYNVHMVYYQGTASGRPWGALAINGYEENGLYYTSIAKDSIVYASPNLTSVTIPSSVIYIGDNAIPSNNIIDTLHLNAFMFNGFASNKYNMDSVSVLYIGASPFWPSAFTSNNPNIITIHVEAPRTSIPSNAFNGSVNLSAVTLPNTITSIGSFAFGNCSSLTTVLLPNSITTIGHAAFWDWTGLVSITIPNSVTTIEGFAFYNCINLESITIPNSVTSIEQEAFENCFGLQKVVIPNSVTSIGTYAFRFSGIDTLYYDVDSISFTYNNRPAWDSVRVVYIGDNVRVWPSNLLSGLSRLTTVVIGNNTITAIPDFAFNGCVNLSSVTIPNQVTSIGQYSFGGCSSLVSFTIPNSITTIGTSAFGDCISLSDITIPNSVNNIGSFAFSNCSSLVSVALPNTITSIESYLFEYCSSLLSVSMPNSVSSIGPRAFYKCTSLTSVAIGDSVTTIGGKAFYGDSNLIVLKLGRMVSNIGGEAFIGTRIDTLYFEADSMGDFLNYNRLGWDSIHVAIIGNHVRSIPAYTFYNCKNLSSVTIPNSVTSIREAAFQNCSNLSSVTIPNSVTSIREAAFQNCSNLSSVILGDSVVNIGNYSFYGDSNLTVLRLGRSINTIGNGAFTGTRIDTLYYNIENINISSDHHLWDSVRAVYLGDNVRVWPTYLLRGLQRLNTVVVGDSITSIPNYTMYGCIGLTSITIGNSVTSIGSNAFKGCSSLVDVEMPNSVTSIGSYAFENCTGLASLTIPSSVTTIGSYAFSGCSSLVSITIPNSVTSINSNTFHGCSSLESVTIPNSVTSIGFNAFQNCSSLTSVTIPNSVTTFGSSVFMGCTSLRSVSLPEQITSINNGLFNGCSSLASIRIPDSVTNIGANAFNGCVSLTSISLGKNLRSLNNNTNNAYNSCFGGCVSLDTLYYDCDSLGKYHLTSSYGFDSISVVYVGTNVRYWPSQLFSGRQKLREATINVSKTPIADGAFSSCRNLSKVTILDSVKVIGYSAFSNCDSLKYVYISDSVDSISTWAFAYCGNIREINLPKSITNISSYIFYECHGLRSIVIPDSVSSIGYHSFYNCDNLTTVSLGKKLQNIEYEFWPTFDGCVSIDTLYINCDSINCFPLWSSRIGFDSISVAYVGSNVRYWPINLFRNYRRLRSVIIDTGVSNIGPDAFSGCTNLIDVVIPNSVTSIGQGAFWNCTSLSSVTIPNSVTTIEATAFSNCSSLTAVAIPNMVTTIESMTFSDCSSLISITIPNSVTTIGNSAFSGCSSLSSIIIPNSVTTIGNSAFSGCSSLSSIAIPNSVTTIGNSAFSGCSSLSSIAIPNSITTIGSWAFLGCSSLLSVAIPNSLTTIGKCTFYGCSSLSDLTLGDSVVAIGQGAFDYCSALDSVVIPNTVVSIGDGAFQHCGSLSSITFGDALAIIGDSVFSNCNALHSVTALCTTPPSVPSYSTNVFPDSVFSTATLNVRCESVWNYMRHNMWGLFDSISGFGEGAVEWPCYITSCDSYTWINGQTYTYNSNGSTFYQEAIGVCDTMYVLRLTIHPTYSRTVLLEVCDNMLPYNYADTLLQDEGLHNVMFQSQHGCDSLIRLDFRIKPTYETVDNLVLCQSMLPYYSSEYDTVFNDEVGWWSYGYMRQSIHGCDSLITLRVGVHPSENTEICMVTVENGHNNVIWNRTADLMGYNIYREGLTANQYDLVATILADTMMSSTWIDTDSDPVSRSYRYRIASVDKCDIESDWSPVHRTMHLTINQGIGNTWNLVWSEYEGADYSTYQIYRGTSASDVELIDEMPSNNTSYTDQNVEQSTVYYQVAIVKDEPCYNTKSTNIIRSNLATSNYEGVQVAGDIKISVYPNPANKMITIDADSYIKRVDLLDMLGRCLKSFGADGLVVNISLDDYSSGIYMLRVTTDEGTALHKFTIE